MIPNFRAWDKVEKEWLEIKLLGFWEDNELWYLEIESGELLFEDDLGVKWELLQSTGIKDKNGVEIFEGDVVIEKSSLMENYEPKKFVVVWNEWYCSFNLSTAFNYEVIGNKFEHPHLLKE